MNYACPSNRTFSTSAPVQRKTKLTKEMQSRRDFAKNHKVSIQVNPETGKVSAKVITR